jgi:hypothetical protein
VKWTELYQLATDARCDLYAMDACVSALAESRDASLHGWVTAEVPTARALCAALDAHSVPVSAEVEAHIAMRCGMMMFGVMGNNDEQTSHVPPTLGSSRPAMA